MPRHRILRNISRRGICRFAIFSTLLFTVLIPLTLLATGKLPYKVYVVHTGSMSPTIPSTSAVITREGVYRVGDVTSFVHHGEVITHRLVARKADGTYVTKGDANATVDPWTVDSAHIIGHVVAAPRMLGYWLVYFRHPAGGASLFMALICLALISSITKDLAASAEDVGPRQRGIRRSPLDSELRVLQGSS